LAAGVEAPTDALDQLAVDITAGAALLPRGSAPALLSPPHAAECGAALAVALRDGPVPTIVDAGRADSPAARALLEVSDVAFVVVRPCYLALRRAVRSSALARASGVVVVDEPQRALSSKDVAEVLDLPVVAGPVACDDRAARRRGCALSPPPRRPREIRDDGVGRRRGGSEA